MLSRLSLVLLAILTTACGAGTAVQSGSELAARIDMPSGAKDDVQVLQAWISSLSSETITISPHADNYYGIHIDARTCTSVSDTELDCTDVLRRQALVNGEASPLMHRLIVSKRFLNPSSTLYCRKLEVRTVTKVSALESPVMTGIGFFADRNARQESLGLQYNDGHEIWIAKGDLHKVGETTLASGEPAVVHRFFDAPFCVSAGSASGEYLAKVRYALKPYVQYDVRDGADVKVYKQWENVSGDHLLDYSGRYSFDRQEALLQH